MNDSSPALRILRGEDGYRLWLRYAPISDQRRRLEYAAVLNHIVAPGDSETLRVAVMELQEGLSGALGQPVPWVQQAGLEGAVCLGTPTNSEWVRSARLQARLQSLGTEGYIIKRLEASARRIILVAANSDIGVLYGTFALLRSVQMQLSVDDLD